MIYAMDRERKINSGKDTRLVVDRSVKGDDGFTDEERDKRVQEVRHNSSLFNFLVWHSQFFLLRSNRWNLSYPHLSIDFLTGCK